MIIIIFAQKGGDYSREGNYLREAIYPNIAPWKLCPKYFVLLSQALNQKMITSNQLNTWAFYVFQISFLDSFSVSISTVSELESLVIGFAGSDSTSS